MMKNSVLCYLEETVLKYPNKTAIKDIQESISFSELRCRALCVSRNILNILSSRNEPILVYLPKSVLSIVTLIGTLYSGNMYTPTDVRFPFKKVQSIIDCLQPILIITNTKYKNVLLENGIEEKYILNVDDISLKEDGGDSKELVNYIIDTDPVYTFFTSGSTGVPKGVTITNRNVIDYIDWAGDKFNINEKTIMGNQSPFYFDISTQDIYTCLSKGATLVIIPESYFTFPAQSLKFIKEQHINFLYWVPSAFVNVATLNLLDKIILDEVTTMMFGGEVMPVKHLNCWKKYLPNLTLIANVYGPTEATVNCTYYIVNREFEDNEILPLGKACENTSLLVLDEQGQLIREDNTNVLGELCVRGSSLSVGYWNDFVKTEEMYVQNPLNKHYPEKIYRTGDLVYYNTLKELVFAGRKDFQIKHMGYRIELGEIENAAMGLLDIKMVCADYDKTEEQIILFYVSKKEIDQTDIRKYLISIIPKYMIPSKYIKVDLLPVNDNGKIDRKKLRQKYILNN